MQRYRLARKGDRIPMPDRGTGVFFTAEPEGEAIDPAHPYYARLIGEGDIKAIEPDDERAPAPKGGK